MKKKEIVGVISGSDLMINAKNKLNRNDGIVKSGTGYHQDNKRYNRKGKKNQQLKNQMKSYGSGLLFLWVNSRVNSK